MADPIRREWMPYSTAAKQYLGVAPDMLLAAIKAGELPAYDKPLTRERKPNATERRCSHFVSLTDVDEWIRAYWPRAFK